MGRVHANLEINFCQPEGFFWIRTPPVSDILCYAGMTPQQSTQNGNEEGHCMPCMIHLCYKDSGIQGEMMELNAGNKIHSLELITHILFLAVFWLFGYMLNCRAIRKPTGIRKPHDSTQNQKRRNKDPSIRGKPRGSEAGPFILASWVFPTNDRSRRGRYALNERYDYDIKSTTLECFALGMLCIHLHGNQNST